MNAKIRFFEFPQVFISLDRFEKSQNYLNRKTYQLLGEKLSTFNTFDHPVTLKIQACLYVTNQNSAVSSEDLRQIIISRRMIRCCKLSSVVRLVLSENIDELPVFVNYPDFCIAVTDFGFFKVCLRKDSYKIEFYNPQEFYISPDTPIIIESDPI